MNNLHVPRIIVIVFFLFIDYIACTPAIPVFARATSYHKTERGCDPDTKKGLTSTKIKLRDSNINTIGMVAVDPKKIPYGSLVYSPDTKRFFLACDAGGAVSNRTAAKKLAKEKGLPKKYSDALVLDFYSKGEILDEHFGEFYVVKHTGSNFSRLYKSSQDLRLKPRYWINHIKKVKRNDEIKEIERSLKNMPLS